jgi:hypothetical protein
MGGRKMNRTMHATRKDILESDDWKEAFGEGEWTFSDVDSPDGVSTAPVCRKGIERVIASYEDCEDGWMGIGVFLMKSNRYLAVHASCCYTGWDCQSGNTLTVAKDLETVVRFGLDKWDARRLGLDHPGWEEDKER